MFDLGCGGVLLLLKHSKYTKACHFVIKMKGKYFLVDQILGVVSFFFCFFCFFEGG